MSNKLTIRLSASALGHSACILNFHRTVIEGYKSIPSAKSVYGTAVAKFVDVMYKTKGDTAQAVPAMKAAFSVPKGSAGKSNAHIEDLRHIMTTCFNFWTEYIEKDANFDVIEIDSVAATEQSFSIPSYYEDDYIIINLEGTPDKIGKFRGGCFAIGDLKTTSSWNSDDYMKRYELSRQLRFYRMALKIIGEREPLSTLGRIGLTQCGGFIDAIFLNKDANANTYKRSEVFQYSDQDILDFQLSVDDVIRKISASVRTGYLPKEGILNGSCEHKWGYCEFWNACKANPKLAQILLDRDFKKVQFTPLNYHGEV